MYALKRSLRGVFLVLLEKITFCFFGVDFL